MPYSEYTTGLLPFRHKCPFTVNGTPRHYPLWGSKSMTLPQLYPGKHTVPGTLYLFLMGRVRPSNPLYTPEWAPVPLSAPPSYARHLDASARSLHCFIVSLFHSFNDDAINLQHPSRPSWTPHTVKILLLISSRRWCVAVATSYSSFTVRV